MKLSLVSCSSAELTSVSFHPCKIQTQNLYLQLVKKSNHLPEDVNVTNLQEGNTIYSINLETGELTNTEVLKVSKQRHLSMINIICETKELKLTSDHPLYIKNYGFCSISRYMALNKISNYEDLIDNIEFGIWNKTTGLINFEKLKNIKIITGDFETYTIGKLTRGKTFISNGFISRTY